VSGNSCNNRQQQNQSHRFRPVNRPLYQLIRFVFSSVAFGSFRPLVFALLQPTTETDQFKLVSLITVRRWSSLTSSSFCSIRHNGQQSPQGNTVTSPLVFFSPHSPLFNRSQQDDVQFEDYWPKMRPVILRLLKQESVNNSEWQDLFW
jgi:hypothetical protein